MGVLKKKKKKMNKMHGGNIRTPTSNVIPVKLKVAINADAPLQHVYMI